ncbi:hypothetical protein [Flexithrix dorotheae]|uniref:hypothetical protein n=1 Tax=Flexithrix dorotheae TaxID=70993 RepID=UPI00035D2668|nr:hypothetical protein [Flexithrix dorotheae]
MENTFRIGVYRRFDTDLVPTGNDGEKELALHLKRKKALHEVLDNENNVKVSDWGTTDDTSPYEYVEILLGIAGSATFNYVIVPGIKFIAEKFAEKVIEESATEFVKWMVSKMRPKQKAKEVLDFRIDLPDGTSVSIDPPDRNATISITFKDGSVESVNYQT